MRLIDIGTDEQARAFDAAEAESAAADQWAELLHEDGAEVVACLESVDRDDALITVLDLIGECDGSWHVPGTGERLGQRVREWRERLITTAVEGK
jgi:hypothetical protein